MPKVLIVEDDELIAQELIRALSLPGYQIDTASTGREGIAKAMGGEYDLLTLDRMLPDLDGLTILSTMRGIGMETPVMVVSSMGDVDNRVQGLRAGGDDYLTKPFSVDEMRARVEALLRRRPKHDAREVVLRVRDLELDLVTRRVAQRGALLDLQPTEFRVLEFMMRNAGKVVTRTMIFEEVWRCRFDPGTNLIDVHMGRLRRKVDAHAEDSDTPMIRTIRGSGYLLS